jgi:hypothetical protein
MVSSLSGTGELDDVIPGFCIRNWSVGLLSPSLAAAPFGHANPIGLLQDRQNMLSFATGHSVRRKGRLEG